MNYAVIMAGGSGTRLWPLSRQKRPKQTLPLTGERSLYQLAVDRLAALFPLERILVVTCPDHAALLQKQPPHLPRENFVIEPAARGTAPAIGLAALHVQQRDPDGVMVVVTADHSITDLSAFHQALLAGLEVADRGFLVTLGIRPQSPETGFGYIHQGESLGSVHGLKAFRVHRFVEKPAREAAERMVASGDYSWNSGMFVWQVSRVMEEFERQMPGLHAQLMQVKPALNQSNYAEVLGQIWPAITKQTIDYGIMEKAAEAAVLPVEIGWSDVGSWRAVRELLPVDPNGNALTGPNVVIDTRNTFVFGGKRLIAMIGVKDLVLIDTEDALLVCAADREQEVKEIVEQLKKNNYDQWV
jgi:mannose-1-phosphate guanylyltransferase